MPRSSGSSTRARLLETARACLLDGAGDFEMGDLSAGAGVSEGLPYRYFGSKAGVVSAVVDDFYDRFETVANNPGDLNLAWEDRERHRLAAVVDYLSSEPLASLVFGRMSRSLEVAAIDLARQERMVAFARRNIQRGQQRGEIPADIDAGVAAAAIIGGLRHGVMYALESPTRPSASMLTAQLWDLTAGALRLGAHPSIRQTESENR